MIHSLAGGELKNEKIFNLAKLEFEDLQGQYFWYIFENIKLEQGDFVLAPFGIIDNLKPAKVIKVEYNVNSKNFTIPYKRLKKIYKKYNFNY